MLEELGIPYDLIRMDPKNGDNKHPEYLKLNPLGHVPTVVDGDQVLFESAAICMQLADQHPDKKLAPPLGSPERGLYYQWIFFAMCELEPQLVTVMLHQVFLPEKLRDEKVCEEAKEKFQKAARVLDDHLLSRSFMLGPDFSTADVVLCSVLNWARWLGTLEEGYPNVQQYIDRCMARPSAKKAFSG
jgi:glutathione S-transferase